MNTQTLLPPIPLINQLLRIIRERHGLSVTELSCILVVPRQTIIDVECGFITPSTLLLIKYSGFFEYNLQALEFFQGPFHPRRVTSRIRLKLASWIVKMLSTKESE